MKRRSEKQSTLEKRSKDNETPRILARQLSRQLNKNELNEVAGAGAGRKCWDTKNGGMFTSLDCGEDQ